MEKECLFLCVSFSSSLFHLRKVLPEISPADHPQISLAKVGHMPVPNQSLLRAMRLLWLALTSHDVFPLRVSVDLFSEHVAVCQVITQTKTGLCHPGRKEDRVSIHFNDLQEVCPSLEVNSPSVIEDVGQTGF